MTGRPGVTGMSATALVVLLAVTSACIGNEALATRSERLGPVVFEVPADWTRADTVGPEIRTSVWTPPDNERKESISIIRVERAAARVQGTPLAEIVAAGQRALPSAHVGAVTPIQTARGLLGARASVSFRPRAGAPQYHRVHITLVDKDALVHVLYTAVDPDHAFEALGAVVDSLRREEG